MSRVRYIINQAGEQVSFDRKRLVRSILAAIRAAKYEDEGVADMIAPMVEVALVRAFGDAHPHVDDVAHFVEQGLRAVDGLHPVAQCYLDRRERNASNPPSADEDAVHAAHEHSKALQDIAEQSQGTRGFHRSSVESALVREYGISLSDAQRVAHSVGERVERLEISTLPSSLLRALIDAELIEQKLMPSGVEVSQASIGLYQIDQSIFPVEEANKRQPVDSPAALDALLSTQVLQQYAAARLHSPTVIEEQARGTWRLGHGASPARVASLEIGLADLCERGAGLELDDLLADEVRDVGAALDRLALLAREANDLCADELVLVHVDSALARFVETAVDALAIARGIAARLSLISPERPVVLKLDALAPSERAGGSIKLALALLDVLGETTNRARLSIEVELSIGNDVLQRREAFALLEHACSRGLSDGGVSFDFSPSAESGERTLFGVATDTLRGMRAHMSVAELDLHRCAELVKRQRGLHKVSHAGLFAQIDHDLPHLVTGLTERAAWLRRFHGRRRESLPGIGPRLGSTLVQSEALLRVDVLGLAEVSRALAEVEDDVEDVARQMQTVLSYIRFKCDGLPLRPGSRLLISDGRRRTREMLSANLREGQRTDPEFTPLDSVADQASGARGFGVLTKLAPWQVRFDAEASLHALASHASLEVQREREAITHSALLQYMLHHVRKGNHAAQRLRLDVGLRQCSNCGNLAPSRTVVCPACGQDHWGTLPGESSLFDETSSAETIGNKPSGKYTVL